MNLKYTQYSDTDSPIMLIDGHIGADDVDGDGVMGVDFCRELMYLDTLGKKVINVWINSGGGVISDGEQIYGTILKTNTPVNTHNVGMAASIAGSIFMAGDKRFMMDYAKFMAHPVSGGDDKSREAFENSCITMLSTRSNMTGTQVKSLMQNTTWLTPEECLNLGICTEVESSLSFNKPLKTSNYRDFSDIVNKLIENKKPTNKMEKVTNKLNLPNDSTEDVILAKIETMAILNKSEIDAKEAELTEIKERLIKAEGELKVLADATKEAEEADLKLKATELVEATATDGKIENTEEVKNKFIIKASVNKESFDTIKDLFDSIPLNKTSANFQ